MDQVPMILLERTDIFRILAVEFTGDSSESGLHDHKLLMSLL